MTAPNERPGPRRAIWGLVNDGYALVAKTANLSHDDAFDLCRIPDIGDPSAYLDHGVAYLRTPKWGHVFARYYTNAERDSAGRASLVYDVVALSDDDFATIGNNAFRALPPFASDRRPERFGELAIPTLVAADNAADAARLTVLLAQEDANTLALLLGGMLAGEHVLNVATGIRVETIECLALLLPPELRPLFTFQSPTVDFPKHTPRLTVAERGHALLVEREWAVFLPRDAEDPRLVEPRANAARLVALGRTSERLRRAWSVAKRMTDGRQASQPVSLYSGVAGMLHLDQLHEGLRTGDLRRSVIVAARAETGDERARLAEALFEHSSADRVATALADVVRGEQRGAWLAVHAIASAVAHQRDQDPKRFASFFTSLADGLRNAPRSANDSVTREVCVIIACAVASLDDLERFLDIADPSLPWETAWRDGSARWVKGRSAVARLFDALAAKGATYGDAIDGINAIGSVTATSAGRARSRASAIGLMLVRRTLRERATLEPPDRLGALVDGLMRIWTPESAVASQPGPASSDDVERAIRGFLIADAPNAKDDPRRTAAELSRTIGESPDGGEIELLGWTVAALERAHAGAVGERAVRVVAALLDDQRRLGSRAELASHVGRVLLHFATSDASFVFRPAWLDVARQVDDQSRRDLLARAIAWVARGYANGRFTIGAVVDACAAVGAEGGGIDVSTVELLTPHLATAAANRGRPTEVALLAATISSIATPAAAERLVEAMLGTVDASTADSVRMHRLAGALHEIEHVRDEQRHADARATLRRVLAQRGTLGAEEERALRVFLGVEDGTVIGRLFNRLPSLTNGHAAVAGDRR